jgi:hypothetical protein
VQSKATHLRDKKDTDQTASVSTLAIGMCRHHHFLGKDGVSVQSLWMDPTTTTSSGHGAYGRGGIASGGRGAMTTKKVKNVDDDEANAMTTITLTLETMMTICVVDYGNCPIVDC